MRLHHSRRLWVFLATFGVVVAAAAFASGAARATFPGSGGRIAFVRGGDIWTMNGDGSDQRNLTNTPAQDENHPAWSPDGATIAFDRQRLPFGDCTGNKSD